ncbi:ribonuclease HII [Chloroflexota bacterium]
MKQQPTFIEEERLWERDYRLIAGIDEAGRGPLAGPVVAAAVILHPQNRPPWLSLVRDSKQLTRRRRESLFESILEGAYAVGAAAVSPEDIDNLGIVAATLMAMRLAVERLPCPPDSLLIDALSLPEIDIPQKGIIKGDCLSLSIAAASIVAKVTRDRIMVEMDESYPGYGFARNMGYPTRRHLENLRRLGVCPTHRRSFAPVREVMGNGPL